MTYTSEMTTGDHSPFTTQVLAVLRSIPRGRVLSYGDVAALSGSPRAARQVVRILSTMSTRYNLPWHRVIGKDGAIRLPRGGGYEEQEAELRSEGVEVAEGMVDLVRFRADMEEVQIRSQGLQNR